EQDVPGIVLPAVGWTPQGLKLASSRAGPTLTGRSAQDEIHFRRPVCLLEEGSELSRHETADIRRNAHTPVALKVQAVRIARHSIAVDGRQRTESGQQKPQHEATAPCEEIEKAESIQPKRL